MRRIGHVFEDKLEDPNQAFDAVVNAFSEDFGDDETARFLEHLAQVTNRWTELINTANGWLGEQSEGKKRIQLCLRLGKWYGEDLGHPEYAQPYYQQIMALDPEQRSGPAADGGHSSARARNGSAWARPCNARSTWRLPTTIAR